MELHIGDLEYCKGQHKLAKSLKENRLLMRVFGPVRIINDFRIRGNKEIDESINSEDSNICYVHENQVVEACNSQGGGRIPRKIMDGSRWMIFWG